MNNYSKAIKHVSVALFLIVFNINIVTIDILPNWVGFYLIYKAIQEIGKIESSALLMNKISFFLFGYHLLEWILNIFGVSLDIVPLYLFVNILALYLYYHLFTSISLICESKESSYTEIIVKLRNILTVTHTLSSLSIYLMKNDWDAILFMIMITYILSMMIMIFYLNKVSKEECYSFR